MLGRAADGVSYTVREGLRVELGADDLVGAVGENGDTPVADKGDELTGLHCFDLGAHVFGVGDTGLSFDVDQNKVVGFSPEQRQPFGMAECGVDVKAGDAKDLVTKRAQHLATADVQDGVLLLCRCFHCV